MNMHPQISVVMAVHNAAASLSATLTSIQQQQGLSLEIVVVNDGSSDATPRLLDQAARQDPRLRVLHCSHRGLTLSLIEACQAARGDFIARQDAGDRSLPGRLLQQWQALVASPQAVLCSSHARFVVPEGAVVHEQCPRLEDLQDGLTGPAHHGSVMMRTEAYRQAGGYRPMFYFAQDIDLWSRLCELGSHALISKVLYEAGVAASSISGLQSREQRRFHGLIRSATKARRRQHSEAPYLARAEVLSAKCRKSPVDQRRRARGEYFIGACLQQQHPELACRYLHAALQNDPWHFRARMRLARCR
jgi:glycosyltransferase involved in cell wall biosynthesis